METWPHSVLVAVDFGEASARAVEIGGLVAGSGPARLRLLHAETLDAPPYFTSEQIEELEGQRESLRRQARKFLAAFGRQHTSTPFEAILDDGPPAEAVLRHAEADDLIVMGTHGRHGPRRWWIGSVAERVLGVTHQPLLVVRTPSAGPAGAAFERIMVYGEPERSGAARPYAARLAARTGGRLIDRPPGPAAAAIEAARPTLVVANGAGPIVGPARAEREALLRHCTVPILFVPQVSSGGSE